MRSRSIFTHTDFWTSLYMMLTNILLYILIFGKSAIILFLRSLFLRLIFNPLLHDVASRQQTHFPHFTLTLYIFNDSDRVNNKGKTLSKSIKGCMWPYYLLMDTFKPLFLTFSMFFFFFGLYKLPKYVCCLGPNL